MRTSYFILLLIVLWLNFNAKLAKSQQNGKSFNQFYKESFSCKNYNESSNKCQIDGYTMDFVKYENFTIMKSGVQKKDNLTICRQDCKNKFRCKGIKYKKAYSEVECYEFQSSDNKAKNKIGTTIELKMCCKKSHSLDRFFKNIDDTCKLNGIMPKQKCLNKGDQYFMHWSDLYGYTQFDNQLNQYSMVNMEECKKQCENHDECSHVTIKYKAPNYICTFYKKPRGIYVAQNDVLASILVCCGSTKKEKRMFCNDVTTMGDTQCKIYCKQKTDICNEKRKEDCINFCISCIEICYKAMTHF